MGSSIKMKLTFRELRYGLWAIFLFSIVAAVVHPQPEVYRQQPNPVTLFFESFAYYAGASLVVVFGLFGLREGLYAVLEFFQRKR